MGILNAVVSRLTGAAERASGEGLKAFAGFAAGGVRGMISGAFKSAWGTGAEYGLRGAYQGAPWAVRRTGGIPGVLRELFPSVRNRTLGALPKFGVAGGIDAFLQTPDGEDLSGAARFGLQAVSFGMRFGAYRSLARGVAGTVLGGAGRISGKPNAYFEQYRYIADKLGPFWKSGSLTNKALKFSLLGAREVVATPVRAVLGIPGTIGAAGSMAGRMLGDTFRGRSMSAALHPRIGGGFGKMLHKVGILNKAQDAPIMSTLLAAGAGAQYFRSKAEYEQRNASWIGGPKYNPVNYGAGVAAMRRGQAQNYGPALTLMLHAGHRRVMP
jgi:hypothetical protein